MPASPPEPSGNDKQPPQRGGPRRPRGSRDPKQPRESPRTPSSGPLLLLIVLGALFAMFWFQNEDRGSEVPYSYFWGQLQSGETGNVAEVDFQGEVLVGKWRKTPEEPPDEFEGELEETTFHTILPQVEDRELLPALKERNVEIEAEEVAVSFGAQMLLWMLGPLLLLGFFLFMMRRSADPMGGGMMGNFIRSPARRFFASEQRTTFDEVAGMQQAKAELEEVVEFLKNSDKFLRLGAHIPKGVLLMGPPGTGKTLLARATAGEAGVPFYSINGSEFIQMFVGVGASRVRDLFKTAKDNAPCIIFIDEMDAVGRVRGAGLGGGHDEREQTLNQILSEMDGFMPAETVIVLAATNRPDVLDPALLRPGRFDRHITIDRPTREGRAAILKVHCRRVPLGDDVDLNEVAAGTIGFAGADLRNLVNEAALNASRNDRTAVSREDFETARDRVMMGPKREEVLSEHEREMIAFHEAGHALLAWLLPEADPVHKVTIIPRGRALGVTQLLPDEDRYNIGEKRLRAQIVVAMGGRAAEKLIFDEFSAGAEDDLKRSTQIARRMISHWGMSEVVGPVAFRQGEEHPFLGKEIHEHREFSEDTARIIDQEVQRILTEAHDLAYDTLAEYRERLESIAEKLLDKEFVEKSELEEIIGSAKATVIRTSQFRHEGNGQPGEPAETEHGDEST